MERQKIDSSQIKSVGYDVLTQTLEIEFKSRKIVKGTPKIDDDGNPFSVTSEIVTGSVYQYDGVPEAVYKTFLESESAGKFFGKNIKGIYPFRKIQEEYYQI